ncbi:hypothetical protein DUI87_03644 [Hirundo rustica rustica]|uniref:Uncharacterized protein n=1 Tax=Hirundo rustica rustica TaxID=333673 RepID=A0A3M0L7L5_HIRRU|nr:hypothetical protein DUI87_03644 [Hirundo rustica rustica]
MPESEFKGVIKAHSLSQKRKAKASVLREDIIAINLLTVKWFSNNTGVKNEDNRYNHRMSALEDSSEDHIVQALNIGGSPDQIAQAVFRWLLGITEETPESHWAICSNAVSPIR